MLAAIASVAADVKAHRAETDEHRAETAAAFAKLDEELSRHADPTHRDLERDLERVTRSTRRPFAASSKQFLGKWHPEQLWLFGSRARGEARGDSDWDLFVVLPDDLDEEELDPVTAWRLRKEAGVRADIVPYHAADFVRDRDTPNTIAYEIAREGLLLYER